MRKIVLHSKFFLLLLLEIFVGIVSSLVMALAFFKIFHEIFEADTLNLDKIISGLIYSWRSPGLTKIMMFVTDFGAEYMIGISILVVILLIWEKHKREALAFTIILVMGVILNLILKEVIQRSRPEIMPLVIETSYSFPSGHAMNSSVFYLAMAFYVYHFTRKKKLSLIITVMAMTLMLLIGFSRVYLGVHYPSDVVAGYVVGTWWLITAILISKSVSFVKHFREEKKKLVY
ncbi:MAG: phosphatase PAP2 family protein [Candidatus Shapirobacteria bacterium]